MRISKEYDVRRNEIVDAAEMLFAKTGYEKTTINNILENVGIGKGTFYHYFKSKEELADAVISRVAESFAVRIDAARLKPAENAHDKMLAVLSALRITESLHHDLLLAMGNPYNAFLHQKYTVKIVELIAPILAAVAEEGIAEGFYKSDYPLEEFEIIGAATQTLHNWNFTGKSQDEMKRRRAALVRLMELSVDAPKGSFNVLFERKPLNNDGNGGA